jgi:hypothetical protein
MYFWRYCGFLRAALGKTCFRRLQGPAEAGFTSPRARHISARRIV